MESCRFVQAVSSLVVDAEERLALFTLLLLVDELVERVEARAGGAVDVVPPVADEVLLIENGSVGAKEAVGVAVRLAHVEHLQDVVGSRPNFATQSTKLVSANETCLFLTKPKMF